MLDHFIFMLFSRCCLVTVLSTGVTSSDAHSHPSCYRLHICAHDLGITFNNLLLSMLHAFLCISAFHAMWYFLTLLFDVQDMHSGPAPVASPTSIPSLLQQSRNEVSDSCFIIYIHFYVGNRVWSGLGKEFIFYTIILQIYFIVLLSLLLNVNMFLQI